MITLPTIQRLLFLPQRKKSLTLTDRKVRRELLFVKETPFYATMGGQEGDCGVIETANGEFVVEDTIKLRGGKFGHVGYMESRNALHRRNRFP